MPGPKALGIDEIPVRKGHTYRIVVSQPSRVRFTLRATMVDHVTREVLA